MLTYEDIKTQVEAGQTNAEIVAGLKQDIRHKRDISATGGVQSDNLLHMLSARFYVLLRNEDNVFDGPLADYIRSIKDSTDPQDVQKVNAIRLLLMTINVTGQQVFCSSDLPAAGMIELIIPIIGQLAPYHDEAAVRADVYRVTGGPKYAGLVEQDIEDLKVLEAERALQQEAFELEEAKYKIISDAMTIEKEKRDLGIKPHDDRYALAVSNLSAYDVNDKTQEEIQTFVDSILNSADGNIESGE